MKQQISDLATEIKDQIDALDMTDQANLAEPDPALANPVESVTTQSVADCQDMYVKVAFKKNDYEVYYLCLVTEFP